MSAEAPAIQAKLSLESPAHTLKGSDKIVIKHTIIFTAITPQSAYQDKMPHNKLFCGFSISPSKRQSAEDVRGSSDWPPLCLSRLSDSSFHVAQGEPFRNHFRSQALLPDILHAENTLCVRFRAMRGACCLCGGRLERFLREWFEREGGAWRSGRAWGETRNQRFLPASLVIWSISSRKTASSSASGTFL